jgi:hypothetical protein
MTLEELNKRFVYKTDEKRLNVYEDWSIPKIQDDGKIYGDCEDYLLALIFLCNIKVEIYFAVNKVSGAGHVIGKLNNQYIDNNTKKFEKNHLSIYKMQRKITYAEMYLRIFLSKIKFYKLIQVFRRGK